MNQKTEWLSPYRIGAIVFDFALGLIVVCAVGCGERGSSDTLTGAVSGQVTFEGQPLSEGQVEFYSKESGTGAATALDPSGKFQFSEPLQVGSYQVSVMPPPLPEPQPDVEPETKQYPNIPEKYRSALTSDLRAEVKEGQNSFSFDMKP